MIARNKLALPISYSDIYLMVKESVRRICLSNHQVLENKVPWNKKWDKESCYNLAKECGSRRDMEIKSKVAYRTALKNGWINDYTWFSPSKTQKRWTRETCYSEAKKYQTRKEFETKSKGAYLAAVRNGWLSDYTWLPTRLSWDKESCYSEAQKYNSRAEFASKNASAYQVALKNGWLNDYTWFKKRNLPKENIYIVYSYNDEDTNSVYVGLTNNLKLRHRQHCRGFLRHGEIKYDIVYRYFHSIGKTPPEPIILEKDLYADEAQIYEELYVEHYKNEGMNVLNLAKAGSLGGYSKWDKDTCYNEAKKYKSRVEFEKKAKAAYSVALKNGWIDDYTWFSKLWGKWNEESCYNEAKKYKTRAEFASKNASAYQVALRHGWINTYEWMPQPKKWNYEDCYNEAKKYKTLKDFKAGNGGAYYSAQRHGWIKNYTWFEQKQKPKGYWTYEKCFDEASKYKSRTQFSSGASTAYEIARKNGWLDDYTWFKPSRNKSGK